MKFILIMVYVMNQKTSVIQAEFDSQKACLQAGNLIQQQMHNRVGIRPDTFVCVAKG